MIVKVQMPLMSNKVEAQAFVYDEKREFETFIPITKTILKYMDGEPKKYFEAHIKNGDELVFDKEIPWQDW